MGRNLYLEHRLIPAEQWKKFKEGKAYISTYDLDIVDKEEYDRMYKSFFFDLLSILKDRKDFHFEKEIISFDYLEEHWEEIMEEYGISYDIMSDNFDDFKTLSYQEWIDGEDCPESYLSRDYEQLEDGSCIIMEARFD